MAKIIGWTFTDWIFRQDSMHYCYVSTKNRMIVAGKTVTIDGIKTIKLFKTKEAGISYAVKYMRAHPKG